MVLSYRNAGTLSTHYLAINGVPGLGEAMKFGGEYSSEKLMLDDLEGQRRLREGMSIWILQLDSAPAPAGWLLVCAEATF